VPRAQTALRIGCAAGSSYLMAHGLGTPAEEVSGTFTSPAAGSYRVLVRTKDWYAPHGIGKFRILIDGKPLETTFGTEGGGKWVWQDGGRVQLSAGEHRIALDDLTGLHGRCDCILLTDDDRDAAETIDILGLDSKRLCALRRAVFIELEGCFKGMAESEFADYVDEKLKRNADGHFAELFTTIRQYGEELRG